MVVLFYNKIKILKVMLIIFDIFIICNIDVLFKFLILYWDIFICCDIGFKWVFFRIFILYVYENFIDNRVF